MKRILLSLSSHLQLKRRRKKRRNLRLSLKNHLDVITIVAKMSEVVQSSANKGDPQGPTKMSR